MDFDSTHSNLKKSSSNQAQKHKSELKTNQDQQKLSKKGTFNLTHPNIKKGINIMVKDDLTVKQCQKSSNYYSYLKINIILDYMFQFSLLLSLILVQCITSSFQDSIFTFMLVTFIVVNVLAIGICINYQGVVDVLEQRVVKKKQGENKNGVIMEEEKNTPTVHKIKEELEIRLTKKTRKLQQVNKVQTSPQNTQQTIKQGRRKTADKDKEEGVVKIRDHKRYVFCFFKVLRVILSIIFPSICLFKLTDDNDKILIKALSITIYIVAFTFSIVIAFLYKNLPSIQSNKTINLGKCIDKDQPCIQMLDSCIEQQGPQTKISIQQLISVHFASRKKTYSFQHNLFSSKPSPSQIESQVVKQDTKYERNKEQVQRIILKSSKSNFRKMRKEILDDIGQNNKVCTQRKKVEINSKKIEYFQYSEITQSYHSRSMIEDKEFIDKLKRKAKYSGQRSKYMQQRIQNQAQLLKRMRINREKKTKSSVCFGVQNQMIVKHKNQESQALPSCFLS